MEMIDGVAMNKAHPDTFEIPSDAEKAAITSENWVKVGFIAPGPKANTERMWVKVTKMSGDDIEGVLDNDPVLVPHLITAGDVVKLKKIHVLAIT